MVVDCSLVEYILCEILESFSDNAGTSSHWPDSHSACTPRLHPTIWLRDECNLHPHSDYSQNAASIAANMVLQDLGRRINAAVSDLTRSSNLDEKVMPASKLMT